MEINEEGWLIANIKADKYDEISRKKLSQLDCPDKLPRISRVVTEIFHNS